ncbi:PLDc N-terminal domain-containing protein [Oleiharenicola sp. Vm1]|uniref:PLDc N-terminal domain-containing protein n=1 Tax=Oleiharenicola sp. Vm1 TaxID=3398393 RepID=UPI0039F5207C
MNALLAVFGFGLPELLLVALILAGFAFWIWMIVDCITLEPDPTNKIAWLLVILLVGVIGAPLYFFVRKLPRGSQSTPPAFRH